MFDTIGGSFYAVANASTCPRIDAYSVVVIDVKFVSVMRDALYGIVQ